MSPKIFMQKLPFIIFFLVGCLMLGFGAMQKFSIASNANEALNNNGQILIWFFAIIFLAFGGIPLGYGMYRNHSANTLKRSGQKISGVVSGVEKNITVYVNDKYPYQIMAAGKVENKEYVFNSDYIWFDPSEYVKVGQPIDIYIDPKNVSHSYVDTSFLPKQ